MRSRPGSPLTWVRLLAAAGLVAGATIALAIPAGAVAGTSTWTGGSLPQSPNWSDAGNWQGGAIPANGADLVFPSITGCEPGGHSLCATTDDLPGLSVHGITVTGDYALDGSDVLALGAGGVSADFSAVPSPDYGGLEIGLPLQLTASQTWAIANATFDSEATVNSAPNITLTTNSPRVSLAMAPSGVHDEIGTFNVVGGSLDFGPGSINTSSGMPINLTEEAQLIGDGATGPVHSTGGELFPGTGASGTLAVTGGVSLDAASFLDFAVGGDGAVAGTDYTHLTATGAVNLGSALFDVSVGDPSGTVTTCPTLTLGAVYTLVTAASITGTLDNQSAPVPDGGYVPLEATGGCHASPNASLQIHYTPTAVTATVSPAITQTQPVTGAQGYHLVAGDGGVFSSGDAGFFGSLAGTKLNQPVVGMAATSDGRGYWLVASDGGVFSFGDAGFFGSLGGTKLNRPVVGMAATSDGRGYWLVASDGGVFSFGDAGFFGSLGGVRLNRPVVGMAATSDGRGYWLVASDGGVFSFGDAGFFGSLGGVRLNRPVVGMAATSDGRGYWLVASDGGVFSFGDAGFFGSLGGVRLIQPVVGMAATSDGQGYWLAASDGHVYSFGDAGSAGSAAPTPLIQPIVGMAGEPAPVLA